MKKAKPKKTAEPAPERWISAHLEDAWIEETTGMVLLRFSTGGYRGEWGSYQEKRVDVKIQGEDL